MSEKDNPLTEAFFYILLSLRHLNHGYGIIQEGGGYALRSVADHAEARVDPRGEPGD